MKSPIAGIAALFVLFAVLIVGYSSVFTVDMTEQSLVVRLGEPIRVVTEPGLNFKAPFIDTVISIDKRILDLENPSQEVIASDQKRLVVSRSERSRPPTSSSRRCSTRRCAACSARSRSSRWCGTSARP